MTRLLLVLSVVVLTACGPDTSAWQGKYTGAGSYTAGRPPVVITGTLDVSAAGQFLFTGKSDGPSFSGALEATSVTATEATFRLPATGTVNASPADGCTRRVTVNMARAVRDGSRIEGTFSGVLNTECTGGSTTNESFLIDFQAQRS